MRRERQQRIQDLREKQRLLREKLSFLENQAIVLGASAPFSLVHDKDQAEKELRAVEAELDQVLAPPTSESNPYVGLCTFEEKDARLFFGREALVAELVDKVRQWPFLAVMGPSGSGKSSVVRAGLIPELKAGALPGSESWLYTTLKPGVRPLDALAVALARLKTGDSAEAVLSMRRLLAEEERGLLLAADLLLGEREKGRLVLVVDQAEELVTLAPAGQPAGAANEQDQSGPFIRHLLTASAAGQTPVCVIITLRADFLGRVAEYPDLARRIADYDVIVSAMSEAELRDAICQPAAGAGGELEEGLADELAEQVAGKPGALPLLEDTLLALWKARTADNVMTWDAYRTMGRVEGALAARAEAILSERYSSEQQLELRRLLPMLVQPGEGAADSRRRTPLDDLTPAGRSPYEVFALLKPLVDERLLTMGHDDASGKETAEVSHEALIKAWPTLAKWIDEDRDLLRLQRQLAEAAGEWQSGGFDRSYLYRGSKLDTAKDRLAPVWTSLNELNQAFLIHSIVEEGREMGPWLVEYANPRKLLDIAGEYLESPAPEDRIRAIDVLRRAFADCGDDVRKLLLATVRSDAAEPVRLHAAGVLGQIDLAWFAQAATSGGGTKEEQERLLSGLGHVRNQPEAGYRLLTLLPDRWRSRVGRRAAVQLARRNQEVLALVFAVTFGVGIAVDQIVNATNAFRGLVTQFLSNDAAMAVERWLPRLGYPLGSLAVALVIAIGFYALLRAHIDRRPLSRIHCLLIGLAVLFITEAIELLPRLLSRVTQLLPPTPGVFENATSLFSNLSLCMRLSLGISEVSYLVGKFITLVALALLVRRMSRGPVRSRTLLLYSLITTFVAMSLGRWIFGMGPQFLMSLSPALSECGLGPFDPLPEAFYVAVLVLAHTAALFAILSMSFWLLNRLFGESYPQVKLLNGVQPASD